MKRGAVALLFHLGLQNRSKDEWQKGVSPTLLRTRDKRERSKETTQLHFSQAFTIVELLIVIVIIAILAAVTIISYTGISARARDASLESEANQLSKVLKTKQVTSSSNQVLSMPDMNVAPTSIDEFLTANNLTSFKDKMCVRIDWRPGAVGQPYSYNSFGDQTSNNSCWPDFVEGQIPQFDKTKLYFAINRSTNTWVISGDINSTGEELFATYSYYSNQQNQWIYKYIRYNSDENPPDYEEEGVDMCSPRDYWGESWYNYEYDYSECRYVHPIQN